MPGDAPRGLPRFTSRRFRQVRNVSVDQRGDRGSSVPANSAWIPIVLGVALAGVAVAASLLGRSNPDETSVEANTRVVASAPAATPPIIPPSESTEVTSPPPTAPTTTTTSTASRGRYCVVDTTPLNVREGPGTEYQAVVAIPIDRCDVFDRDVTPEVRASAAGGPWRHIDWQGTTGWVADWMLSSA